MVHLLEPLPLSVDVAHFDISFLSISSANEKTVHYLIASDGNPWVWVIDDDLDILQKKAEGIVD